MSRLLLLSTYELGHQPLGISAPAAWLAGAGHVVRARDLAIEQLEPEEVDWADGVVCSVPMHTAMRLALSVLEAVRARRPMLPVALHGLYAQAGAPQLRPGDLAVAGEASEALLEWADGLARAPGGAPSAPSGPEVRVELGRPRRSPPPKGGPAPAGEPRAVPDRRVLPSLERYARLVRSGGARLVGSVEASRGCSHRCRHCPVPAVYSGRTRAVPVEDVLADVDQLVEAGAGHVHFADPDFLNRPAHASRLVEALHARHPELSFDATVKVSHVLRHRDVVRQMGGAGCLFVVSAFESTSATVLERLAKGHTAEDAAEAVRVLRAAGIEPRPSFLPFTPWTEAADVVSILDFVAAHDLIESVDPVQYGIRLLLPPGSLLLEDPDPVLEQALRGYDPEALGWTWSSADPRLDELQQRLAALAEEASLEDEPAEATYAQVRRVAFESLGRRDPGPPEPDARSRAMPGPRPRLSESWFCCAEPTAGQVALVGASELLRDPAPAGAGAGCGHPAGAPAGSPCP